MKMFANSKRMDCRFWWMNCDVLGY